MADDAPDAIPDEVEFVWVANKNPDILPTRMSKAALDPDLEDGPASKGWSQVGADKARALSAADVAAQSGEVPAPPAPHEVKHDKK